MTAENQNKASIVKQPLVIGIILVVVAVVLVAVTQKPKPEGDGTTAGTQESADQVANPNIKLKPPTTASAGQNTPKLVQSMASGEQKAGQVTAPGLESLVKGLEDKVAKDPSLGNRLLLAQTYNELGMQDKALTGIRELQKENPDNSRVNLVLSSMLSRSNDSEKLKESLTILDKLSGDDTVQQYLVNLYKGDALIRSQDHDGALKHWKLALESMPAADNRRAILEKRIADLSIKEEKKGS